MKIGRAISAQLKLFRTATLSSFFIGLKSNSGRVRAYIFGYGPKSQPVYNSGLISLNLYLRHKGSLSVGHTRALDGDLHIISFL